MSNRGSHQQPTHQEAMDEAVKVRQGLIEGDLRKLVARVDSFKKEKKERDEKRKSKIITQESLRQEAEAKELEKFMDFTAIFGEYEPYLSTKYGAGVLSAPKEFKYILETFPDGEQQIRYRNIRIWWPISILQQIYGQFQKKEIILAK